LLFAPSPSPSPSPHTPPPLPAGAGPLLHRWRWPNLDTVLEASANQAEHLTRWVNKPPANAGECITPGVLPANVNSAKANCAAARHSE